MIQSGGFPSRLLGPLLGPLLKKGLPLTKNVIKPLTKSVLVPLGLTAAAAADAGIRKKILESGHNTNTNDDSGLLLKGVTETVQNEVKE